MHGMGEVTMKPYLHFGPGDALYFEEWIPTSRGAVFGACVGFLLLAVFERLLFAVKSVLEVQWAKRCAVGLAYGLTR